jgi:hypothetical protein
VPDRVSGIDRHPAHGIDDALRRLRDVRIGHCFTYCVGFASNFVLQTFAQK